MRQSTGHERAVISPASRMGHIDCDAILFDLDGVLIDSTSCVERHWRRWAKQHRLDSDEILRIAHGVRNIDTMRRLAPHLDVEGEAAAFAAHEVEDTAGVVPIKGAAGIIENLRGAPWAVVTSCSGALARARLRAAHLPDPPLLITGDDVARGKPDPQPYLLAAHKLEIAAHDCVVLEDAPAGVRSGKHAGMRVIAVEATHGRDELQASGADVIIAQLSQLHLLQADSANRLVIEIAEA